MPVAASDGTVMLLLVTSKEHGKSFLPLLLRKPENISSMAGGHNSCHRTTPARKGHGIKVFSFTAPLWKKAMEKGFGNDNGSST